MLLRNAVTRASWGPARTLGLRFTSKTVRTLHTAETIHAPMANAELTYLLFNAALAGNNKLGHGRDGYYLTENGEVVLYDLCKEIGKATSTSG